MMVTRVDDYNARPKTEAERTINYAQGRCEGIHSAEGDQWKAVRSVRWRVPLSDGGPDT